MKESDCLIDFDPSPKCPDPYYCRGFDDSPWYDFEAAYEKEFNGRMYALVTAMHQRLLTEEEEIEAAKAGRKLTQYDDKKLSDAWFQQRRLQMLSKGINVQ